MQLTPSQEVIAEVIMQDQHISIQAAAYTIYVELTPSNKKPLSQREFNILFIDNWRAFAALEDERVGE